jgi:hypothetical protein
MRSFISCCVLMLCGIASLGQVSTTYRRTPTDAELKKEVDGTLTINANESRPLLQALDSLRTLYGWVVDYEDPVYGPNDTSVSLDGRFMLRSRTFVSHIHEPKDSSPSETKRVLQEIVDQYNAQNDLKFRIVKLSDSRYDVVPITGSIMDTPVLIDDHLRSIREEVDQVVASLSSSTGTKAVQGGLISNGNEQATVSLRHDKAVPARELMNEILNHSRLQQVWLICYEPSGGYFAIGLQAATKEYPDATGKLSITGIKNPYYKDSR